MLPKISRDSLRRTWNPFRLARWLLPLLGVRGNCASELLQRRWLGRAAFLCVHRVSAVSSIQLLNRLACAALALAFLASAGCQSPEFAELARRKALQSEPLVLHEGDSVRIRFPGAPNLDTVQQIKRDGRISLQLIGEVQAAGLTASQL